MAITRVAARRLFDLDFRIDDSRARYFAPEETKAAR